MPPGMRAPLALLLLVGCTPQPVVRLADGGIDFALSPCSSIPSRELCAARADCVADLCTQCSCTPAFKQCRASHEAAYPCPALGCADPQCCETQNQCTPGTGCLAPGAPAGCGACNNAPESCANDGACSGTQICEPIPCACSSQKACTAGCESTGCSADMACGADHRCHPKACTGASECPSQFACQAGGCVRKSCSATAECPGGFCVLGRCHEGKGSCVPPVP